MIRQFGRACDQIGALFLLAGRGLCSGRDARDAGPGRAADGLVGQSCAGEDSSAYYARLGLEW